MDTGARLKFFGENALIGKSFPKIVEITLDVGEITLLPQSTGHDRSTGLTKCIARRTQGSPHSPYLRTKLGNEGNKSNMETPGTDANFVGGILKKFLLR